MLSKVILLSLSLLLLACQSSFTALTPADLDNPGVDPQVGPDLLSAKGAPTAAQAQSLAIVTTHGYTATPYENKALLDFLTTTPQNHLGSRVMLGAHGEDVEIFERSSWQDWQKPLEAELDKLEALGYQQIALVTTSTGGTLALELLARKNYPHLKKLVLVAPLVVTANKALQFADLVKLIGIRSMPTDLQGHAVGNWYRERPVTTLIQLNQICARVRGQLEQGISLPGIKTLIIQSDQDGTVDPLSSAMVARGISQDVKLRVISSNQHLPTSPYPDWKPEDYTLKDQLFNEIADFIKP